MNNKNNKNLSNHYLEFIFKKRNEKLSNNKEIEKPNKLDIEDLFEIPKGWNWATIDQITYKIGSGITPRGGKKNYRNEGVMFLCSQNIQMLHFDLNNVAFVSEELHNNMSRTNVEFGDVLYLLISFDKFFCFSNLNSFYNYI